DLAHPMGWDPSTKEAFFSIEHGGESGEAPTVVRVRLADPDTAGCEALWWSKAAQPDSTYDARWKRLTKKLVPPQEEAYQTIPYLTEIVSQDTFKTEWQGPFVRFHVSAGFGGWEGRVEAIAYRDPSIRMLHVYYVKEAGVSIGIFSFVGIPWESAYEVQIPAV